MRTHYTLKLDKETLESLRIALQIALLSRDDHGAPPLAFDEHYYIEANPDVRCGVEDRIYRNGYDHYVKFGKQEGRDPVRPLQCATKAL